MMFVLCVCSCFAVTLSEPLATGSPVHLPTISAKALVSVTDLSLCLDSLSRVLEYYSRRRHQLEVTLLFGIFLTKVNLKWILNTKYKALPEKVRNELGRLVWLATELVVVARRNLHNSNETVMKDIALLTVPESGWITRLPPLVPVAAEDLPAPMSFAQFVSVATNLTSMRPAPHVSDKCLAQIAVSPSSPGPTRCETETTCAYWLVRGSRTGYMLAHRLLWIVVGRLARHCYLLPMRGLDQRLCSLMLAEAELIVDNGSYLNDLLAEQMALCSLVGDARFVRRRLVRAMLAAQQPAGCFHDRIRNACDEHCSALSAAASAAAVRYILQKYY